jgi:ribose 5-phosphate isomerase A
MLILVKKTQRLILQHHPMHGIGSNPLMDFLDRCLHGNACDQRILPSPLFEKLLPNPFDFRTFCRHARNPINSKFILQAKQSSAILKGMDQEIAKKAAGDKAASFVRDGMIIGLGTGSTALYFIQALIAKKPSIQTVASSKASADLARKGGLVVLELNQVSHIDLTVDGADEIDAKKRMIKGGGGAHVREKILAFASREMVVIVDETKQVDTIGHTKLPIEILPYGSSFTKKKIDTLGFRTTWRPSFVTDNGNMILDLFFEKPPQHPEKLHNELLHIPGVVDTGFFFGMAGRVIVGKSNGTSSEY